jgi:hypothetical protein
LGRILRRPGQRSSAVEQGTHKPLVTGSIPVAATNSPLVIASEAKQTIYPEQGIRQNHQAYLATVSGQGVSVSNAILRFLSGGYTSN